MNGHREQLRAALKRAEAKARVKLLVQPVAFAIASPLQGLALTALAERLPPAPLGPGMVVAALGYAFKGQGHPMRGAMVVAALGEKSRPSRDEVTELLERLAVDLGRGEDEKRIAESRGEAVEALLAFGAPEDAEVVSTGKGGPRRVLALALAYGGKPGMLLDQLAEAAAERCKLRDTGTSE